MVKRPTDPIQLAKLIGDIATGQLQKDENGKNPAAVALGRRGGLKGGPARAKALSKAKQSSIGRKAAKARWKKAKKGKAKK